MGDGVAVIGDPGGLADVGQTAPKRAWVMAITTRTPRTAPGSGSRASLMSPPPPAQTRPRADTKPDRPRPDPGPRRSGSRARAARPGGRSPEPRPSSRTRASWPAQARSPDSAWAEASEAERAAGAAIGRSERARGAALMGYLGWDHQGRGAPPAAVVG